MTISSYGVNVHSRLNLQTAITANTTSTQASGEALYEGYNEISTVAVIGDSVTLPSAVIGMAVTVYNAGALPADIFPAVGDNIDGLAANLARSIAPGETLTFFAHTVAEWLVDQKKQSQYGITANIGSSQATGEPLYDGVNEISTSANAGDSVTMPVGAIGMEVRIFNNAAANAVDVFPASGADLGAGADTAVSLAAGANIAYFCTSLLNWETMV